MRPWHRTTDHWKGVLWSPSYFACFNEAVAQNHGSRNDQAIYGEDTLASMRPWHRTTDHHGGPAPSRRARCRFNEAVAQNHGSRHSTG